MDAAHLGEAPNTLIGQIATGVVFAIAVITFVGMAVLRYFEKRREAHPDDVQHAPSIELIDTAVFKRDLERMFAVATGIDEKMNRVIDDLQHLKNREEVARLAREEVARLVAEGRHRDR